MSEVSVLHSRLSRTYYLEWWYLTRVQAIKKTPQNTLRLAEGVRTCNPAYACLSKINLAVDKWIDTEQGTGILPTC